MTRPSETLQVAEAVVDLIMCLSFKFQYSAPFVLGSSDGTWSAHLNCLTDAHQPDTDGGRLISSLYLILRSRSFCLIYFDL